MKLAAAVAKGGIADNGPAIFHRHALIVGVAQQAMLDPHFAICYIMDDDVTIQRSRPWIPGRLAVAHGHVSQMTCTAIEDDS